MLTILLLSIALIVGTVESGSGTHDHSHHAHGTASPHDRMTTKSTAAKGELFCGKNVPATNVRVRLFCHDSDDLNMMIDEKMTGPMGMFHVEGNTAAMPNMSTFEPTLKIYHKCDDEEGKKGYRRVTIKLPTTAINNGRRALRPYEVGKINLQLIYPDEDRDKHLEDGIVKDLLMAMF